MSDWVDFSGYLPNTGYDTGNHKSVHHCSKITLMASFPKDVFSWTLAELLQRPCWSPKMLQLQGQTSVLAKSQLHASTLLTWAGLGVSWINRGGSAGWREECQRWWQLGRRHRSLWSTAAPPCLLLAPHLHFYAAVFTHSRRLQTYDRHVTCVDALSFDLCKYTSVLTRVGVWRVHFDRGILFPKCTSRFPAPSLCPTSACF